MSSKDCRVNKGTKRFKGVESFLRRVAFNLGNTPSQTEVKIISCIPIDVTDLQQKIICLEKQLEQAKSNTEPAVPCSVVQAALCRGRPSCHDNYKLVETCAPAQIERCVGCGPKPCLSSTLFPSALRSLGCTCWSSEASCNPDVPEVCSVEFRKKSIFKKPRKKKKNKKGDKCQTQFVYYAQTPNNPFSNYLGGEKPSTKSPTRNKQTMSRAYISEVIRKQYSPMPVIQDYSLASEFSSPICRDVEQGTGAARDSDVCSCCYGPFHNIDRHKPKPHYAPAPDALPTCSFNQCMNNTGFYDTSLYDMVPVREKPTRTTKSHYVSSRRKSPKYPERSQSKTKMHSYIINHYTRPPMVVNYSRKTPAKMYSANEKLRKTSPKQDKKLERLKLSETSNSCCIDCGKIYIKRTVVTNKPQDIAVPATVASKRNAECLTNSLNDTECQTTTTQSVQIDQGLLEEKKTEETLNQIKSILQTVLAEVKTNTQVKKTSEDKSTKDFNVQKGTSQGAMPGCSSLLHSYTYSPYNMNPYIASCSRQMPSGPCYYPTMPYPSAKCMQNFPVFIHTPGRNMCASCYRNNSYVPKINPIKQGTTAATNTEAKEQERTKETEKLIKEIYKSMTVSVDVPTKETSSEYNDLKSTPRDSVNKSLYRASVLDAGMRTFMKAKDSRNLQINASPLSTLNSRLVSNTMSMRSQVVTSTDTERQLMKRRLENYLETVDAQKKQIKIQEETREYEGSSTESTASDEEEESSDVNEHDAYNTDEEPAQRTEGTQKLEPNKKGIFSKMLKSVKLFSSKNKKKEEQIQVENAVDEESEGDSDDYQTVYSQRITKSPQYIPYPVRAVRSPHRIKAHSKISYSRHMQDRNQERSRRPYMEQEYRRHWNERFHEHQRKYSSEERDSRKTPTRPVYYQDYEARCSLVGPNSVNLKANTLRPDIRNTIKRESPRAARNEGGSTVKTTGKGLAWLKKHKPNCGPQWKKFILEG